MIIAKLESYKNESLIALAISRLKMTPQEARQNFLELKKLLYILFLVQERKVEVEAFAVFKQMQKIDDLWHQFILMTKDYSKFCQDVFGTYIHHEPEISTDTPSALSVSLRAQVALVHETWGAETMNAWYVPKQTRRRFFAF